MDHTLSDRGGLFTFSLSICESICAEGCDGFEIWKDGGGLDQCMVATTVDMVSAPGHTVYLRRSGNCMLLILHSNIELLMGLHNRGLLAGV